MPFTVRSSDFDVKICAENSKNGGLSWKYPKCSGFGESCVNVQDYVIERPLSIRHYYGNWEGCLPP